MKQCPTCHFIFADFHHVCSFDGTELVPYEKPQSLMRVSPPPPPPPRSLKPSMSLTSLAVLTVFLSAVLIGYLKSPNPSVPAVVIQELDANSVSSTARAGTIAEEFTAESKPTARATRVRRNLKRRSDLSSPTRLAAETLRYPVAIARVQPKVDRAGNRLPSAASTRQPEVRQTSRTYPPNATIPRPREVQQAPREKTPKVVAILKTTWKVLKKPFDF